MNHCWLINAEKQLRSPVVPVNSFHDDVLGVKVENHSNWDIMRTQIQSMKLSKLGNHLKMAF